MLGHRGVISFVPHARKPALATDRLQQMPHFPWPRIGFGQPGIDAEKSARPQGAEGLIEKALLVRHMLGTLDRIGAVEAGVGQAVREPVLHANIHARHRFGGGIGGLGGRDGEAGHAHVPRLRQIARRRAIAAADIHDIQIRCQIQMIGEEFDQRDRCLGRCLASGHPIAVMDMVAPDLAIEGVEIVVMGRDGGGGLDSLGMDHFNRPTQ
nr:hypothetical protein [Acidisoma sp. PAMC 29798]